jgi:hypothetical protein
MTWGMTAVAGATVIGGVLSSNAAGNAANAQKDAANQANATQTAQFNKQVELNAPFREAGLTAQNQLLTYLGLKAPVTPYAPTKADFNEQAYLKANPDIAGLIGTSTAQPSEGGWGMTAEGPGFVYGGASAPQYTSAYDQYINQGQNEGRTFEYTPEGLARKTAAEQGNTTSPDFGIANKPFSYAPFEYTADPGYAFRISEGNKSMNAAAAARGGLISGNALKAGQDYGQAAASQEYGNAFNRYLANYGNAQNTFQMNRGNMLNPLQSLIGVGQTATGATTAASANYANQYGANTIGAGNAQASGYVGSANAINSGIGSLANMYQTNQLINRFAPASSTYASGGGGGNSLSSLGLQNG